jgi:hypothetical protein
LEIGNGSSRLQACTCRSLRRDRPLKIQRGKTAGPATNALRAKWHDDAISPELGSFCQKSHLIAELLVSHYFR